MCMVERVNENAPQIEERSVFYTYPPSNHLLCHYKSIDSLDSAASPCNKHLTLAFRQTAKESKPSYTEAVSGHLHSVARGGDDDDDDDDDDDGDTLFMCQLGI